MHSPEEVVSTVQRLVESGELPEKACVDCGRPDAELHQLFVVCHRARRDVIQQLGPEKDYKRLLVHLPFFITFTERTREPRNVDVVEGQDVVVPTPICVCRECWNEAHGGNVQRALEISSQVLGISGILAIIAWLITESRGGGFSVLWIALLFGLAGAAFTVAETLDLDWPNKIRELVSRVDAYDALLDAYPDCEILVKEPVALID